MVELVAGVDGCRRGWVAVVLVGGRFREARLLEGVDSSFAELSDMERIAIDVPIGYGPREADDLARARVGGSSVFAIPERERFEAPFTEGAGSRLRPTRSGRGSATSLPSPRATSGSSRPTRSSASPR